MSTSTETTVSKSSVSNLCFVNNYDDNITFINSIYFECSANLQPNQSIKQNVLGSAFSSPQLVGQYVVSINASQSVSIVIVENGTTVFTESGTRINYTGNIASGGSMYFTITNEETTMNVYEFGIDFSTSSRESRNFYYNAETMFNSVFSTKSFGGKCCPKVTVFIDGVCLHQSLE